MEAIRLQVKIPLATTVDLPAIIPVFHRWIREHDDLDPQLVDVADYAHVPSGPGVVLIGHGSDYGVDLTHGTPGLLYFRKRAIEGDFASRLKDAFSHALRACELLEGEASLSPRLAFRTDAIELRIVDRLHAPNTPETLEAVRPSLTALATTLFGESVAIETHGGEREPFRVTLRAKPGKSVKDLRARLA